MGGNHYITPEDSHNNVKHEYHCLDDYTGIDEKMINHKPCGCFEVDKTYETDYDRVWVSYTALCGSIHYYMCNADLANHNEIMRENAIKEKQKEVDAKQMRERQRIEEIETIDAIKINLRNVEPQKRLKDIKDIIRNLSNMHKSVYFTRTGGVFVEVVTSCITQVCKVQKVGNMYTVVIWQ
jgi:DNA replication protein DnaC